MIRLFNQKDYRPLQDLLFCYLCTESLLPNDAKDHDHVVAKSCFELVDRTPPLKLPTHKRCNNAENLNDEKIGQIVSLLHGRVPSRVQHRMLKFEPVIHPITGQDTYALTNADIEGMIRRWVRGFHSALYKAPLRKEGQFAIEPPIQAGAIDGKRVIPRPIRPQHGLFVGLLKANERQSNLDEIIAYNGKLRYRCVWVKLDDGSWMCVFGLDIYGWKKLGDEAGFQPRACVGAYSIAPDEPPHGASTSIVNGLPTQADMTLDPFA